ncbi:amidase [Dissoconium aciculare CBS 342.82]|uniref:amidase n=1 Tax=Dissoconium aciculare CBS 342.82 TaxID=1314786 RepID=A0A6J3LYY6_9PEZI|nr:amidase [Dissoconium aciculare CBS 342.82]KAF1819847.1 amidase [Dissoconium aciculare CBS 342.82]
MPDTWRDISARKLEERSSRIPSAWRLSAESIKPISDSVLHVPRRCGLLEPQELAITEDYDAVTLVDLLAQAHFSSEVVTRAFCKRAAIAQQVSNCLTEILFDDALSRARELDAHLARTGKPIGPLHGLPISLKDSFKVKGYDASVGVANICFKPASENSALVDLLLSLGAVLYCKTNVPQSMMALDSHNNVFGRTLNPANLKLTAGGSSGGEGALLALRGSILGVGTDVGGSIRIPAACNALFGIKPSHGRVPFAGQENGHKPGSSKLMIEATAGPLSQSLRSCEMFLRVVLDASTHTSDPDVLPQDWSQQVSLRTSKRRIRVGIIRTDGHVSPLPPVESFLNSVATSLRAAISDFEIVEVDATQVLSRTNKTFNGIVSLDGANTWFDHFEATGEPLSPWLQGRLTRRKQKSINEIWDSKGAISELQKKFLELWKSPDGSPLDALICPVMPHPVAPIDRWGTPNYTAAFNLLDLPAGVVPVRPLTQEDLAEELPGGSKPLNPWDQSNRELWTKVDRNVYLGSMLSLQVITPRLRERQLVEVMSRVSEALRPSGGREKSARSRL